MALFQQYQHTNRIRRANRWAQIVLSLAFIFCLNYAALQYFQRNDITGRHSYSLSPETRAYLREISQPIKLIVTVPENSPREEERVLHRYLSGLLREYAYYSRRQGTPFIEVEWVDIYKDISRAEVLSREFGLDQPNTVLVSSGDRFRFLLPDDLLLFQNMQPVALKGESAVTSAILEVIQENSPILYFLTGHGEMAPEDVSPGRGLSQLTSELRLRNFTIRTLDLTREPEVPSDADLVIIADPRGDLLPSEIQKLRTYLNDHAGRVIAWIGPGRSYEWGPFLRDWGIRVDDMVVFEPGDDFLESTGNMLIRQFGEHPATDSLIRNQTFVVSGLARPVRPDAAAPLDDRLRTTALLGSSNQSWAERDYNSGITPRFDPDSDLPGPVAIAAVAERRTASQLGIRIPGGRILVFGTRDLFVNNRIGNLGNASLFFSSLNWMLDRNQMLAIPPRPLDNYRLVASQAQLRKIGLWFLAVPGAVALLGIIVVSLRKI